MPIWVMVRGSGVGGCTLRVARKRYCYVGEGKLKGGVRGERLTQDYIRMQEEEEEQEAKVCERERGQPRQ